MTTQRRTILKGLMAGAAAIGLGGMGFGRSSEAQASMKEDVSWAEQQLASTREATPEEHERLVDKAREVAKSEGYPVHLVDAAVVATATMSISPRGTEVGKCGLILDEYSAFVLTQELGSGRLDRVAVQAMWTDGEEVRNLDPSLHAKTILKKTDSPKMVAAAASTCCDPTGQAAGKCCVYNFRGLFECCFPCVGFIGNPIKLAACVAVWCNYCNASHCTRYYSRHNC